MDSNKVTKGMESDVDPYMIKLDKNMKWYFCIVLLAWLTIPIITILLFREDFDLNTWSNTFGSVSALFTSIAFAFIVYTALMQRRELELQRKELELTRGELKRSAEAHTELVEINRMAYKLQLEVSNDTIRPSLGIVKSDWIENAHESGAYDFKFRVTVTNKTLRINKLIVLKNELDLILDNDPPLDKYLQEDTYFDLKLRTPFSEKIHISKINLTVFFSDLLSVSYYQTITIEDNSTLISQPKEYDPSLLQT
tara:strand:- start:1026 stop:1784 length:759 start_codon:yes stop_codon:yes gene_type:complete